MSLATAAPESQSTDISPNVLPGKNGLSYTRWGLVTLFGYLLLGDFCLQFMEQVLPSIMPLQLDAAGASNVIKAAVIGTLAAFFNMVLNPIISFKSDGMRTPFGRRRPILLAMTPFVTLALIFVAYAPEISQIVKLSGVTAFLQGGFLPQDGSMASLVVTLALGVLLFQLFNNLMQPVFYYFFVDVVPDTHMARFISLFRMVGMIASYIFSMWVFPHAITHTREIYLGAAVFYCVGFLIMVLKVKEGDYPPPVHDKRARLREKVAIYFRECYSNRHYVLFNLRNATFVLSVAADIFLIFYLTKSLHISLEDVGRTTANAGLVLLVLSYPLGALADRFKPLRVSFAMMLIGVPISLINFFFITDRESFLLLGFLSIVIKGIVANLDLPFYASVMPQERYGQFGSANQLFVSFFAIGGSLLAGVTMDLLTENGARPEMYRYCFIWNFVIFIVSTVFMYLFYRSWLRHGGPHNHVPPAV